MKLIPIKLDKINTSYERGEYFKGFPLVIFTGNDSNPRITSSLMISESLKSKLLRAAKIVRCLELRDSIDLGLYRYLWGKI